MRWKTVFTVIAAIFAVIAALVWFYRDDIFQHIQDPGQPFQTYKRPIAPNYDKVEAWLTLPDLSIDSFEASAKGDVFVVVPSVYRGGKHWNLPSNDLKRKNKLEYIVRPNYVTPYADAGRLFAPFYRQASLYAYMTHREDARMAQNLAYQDVKRAFEVFMENSPPERPIVLVGHNQGASHVQRLLADFFAGNDNTENLKRLAVAYVIDYPLTRSILEGPLSEIPVCKTEVETNCIVAFGAFAPNEGAIAERFGTRLLAHNGQQYESVEGEALICVNPLLWTQSEDYAPARLHKGGVAAEGLDPDMRPAALPRQVGTQCQDGLLLIDKPRSRSLRRPLKVGGKFRTLPSNLFYEDLRQNAKIRVETLLQDGSLPRRAKLLDGFEVIDVIDSPVSEIVDVKPQEN
ncbi:DUF3089 family protein [Litorimonas taeanensis]|uniref:DUF3089 family protein n=1 Tax=Litorimonas taeanensis TaxID=568099 RepID=A0A420WK74_9PROT|nr:DUF3089 domain-containing protein [Litorimonas taeanensis]RKQ71404.1 DUF3089 family protein [Litorimonas taeanensis]